MPPDTTPTPPNTAKRIALFLARPDLFSWALLWLMILLITGTLEIKTGGLYEAQRRYFSSVVLWAWDAVPLPGVAAVSAWILLGLIARLYLYPWTKANAGTVIVHAGAAMLLLGGFVTAQFSREGGMAIPEGQSRSWIEDYHRVELAATPADGREATFPEGALAPGAALRADGLPFSLDIVAYCRNCALKRLPSTRTEGKPHGVALNFDLAPLPRDPVDERNRAGITFRLRGAGGEDGLYTVFEGMPIPQAVEAGGRGYLIDIRRARTPLPFSIELLKFTRDIYPGTDTPRGFESEVRLRDGGVEWRALIRMNEPLRYKGYTFYQAAFEDGGDGNVKTVLAVVDNPGRLFPYISSIVICGGIAIHIALRLSRGRKA